MLGAWCLLSPRRCRETLLNKNEVRDMSEQTSCRAVHFRILKKRANPATTSSGPFQSFQTRAASVGSRSASADQRSCCRLRCKFKGLLEKTLLHFTHFLHKRSAVSVIEYTMKSVGLCLAFLCSVAAFAPLRPAFRPAVVTTGGGVQLVSASSPALFKTLLRAKAEKPDIGATADAKDECETEEEEEELSETKKLLQQVKDAGVAGFVSYALWEWAFWCVSLPVVFFGYREVTGHWPDVNNKEDMTKVGAEAFAFVNFARFAVPLRIGLALSTTPWIQENVIDRFFKKEEEICDPMADSETSTDEES